jgi:hypothetical protein
MTVPTIQEELNRKTIEQLELLVNWRRTKLISEAEFSIALDTLWNVASGLVDEDFHTIISTVAVNKIDPSFGRSWFLTHGDKWLRVRVTPTRAVTLMTAQGIKTAHSAFEEAADAYQAAETIIVKLEKAGYQQLN